MPRESRQKEEGRRKKKTKTTKRPSRKESAQGQVQRSSKSGARVLQAPKRVWYKPLSWRHRPPVPAYKPLPKARKLFALTLRQLWQHKKLFGGIIVIYGALNVLLVRGVSGSSDLTTIKGALDSITQGFGSKLVNSFTSFTYLLTTSGSGNTATSGVYQGILLIVCSLAFIWALRQTMTKQNVSVKGSFYQGMYPLVPFLLTFLLLSVQLLPLAVGANLYAVVTSNGIAVHIWERVLWIGIFVGLVLWSLRMITATVFALYIVTLPDMTPLKAYRSAKGIVYGRRLLLWRKLLFLPVVLLLLAIAIEVPLILYLTPVAEWAFFVLSMCALPLVHGYLYNLYREML